MSKRREKAEAREDAALDALLVLALLEDAPLPELTDEEREAMDALPPDFINRILAGERPLGEAP